MAELLREETNEAGEIIRYYASGAVYNFTRKKLMYPAHDNLINTQNANAYNRRRQELARAAFVEGANAATAETLPEFLPAGPLAYVHAIGYTTQQKAMTAKDPKQTDAARLALTIGENIGETRNDQGPRTVNVMVLPDQVLQLFQDLKKRLETESSITVSNNMDIIQAPIDQDAQP